MLGMLIAFWYCYDDWLASAIDTPWVGDVHPFIWFILVLATCASD